MGFIALDFKDDLIKKHRKIVDQCAMHYSMPIRSDLLYRIKNAIKHIFGKSDWQQAHRILEEHLVPSCASNFRFHQTPLPAKNIADLILRYYVTQKSIVNNKPRYYISKETWLSLANLDIDSFYIKVVNPENQLNLKQYIRQQVLLLSKREREFFYKAAKKSRDATRLLLLKNPHILFSQLPIFENRICYQNTKGKFEFIYNLISEIERISKHCTDEGSILYSLLMLSSNFSPDETDDRFLTNLSIFNLSFSLNCKYLDILQSFSKDIQIKTINRMGECWQQNALDSKTLDENSCTLSFIIKAVNSSPIRNIKQNFIDNIAYLSLKLQDSDSLNCLDRLDGKRIVKTVNKLADCWKELDIDTKLFKKHPEVLNYALKVINKMPETEVTPEFLKQFMTDLLKVRSITYMDRIDLGCADNALSDSVIENFILIFTHLDYKVYGNLIKKMNYTQACLKIITRTFASWWYSDNNPGFNFKNQPEKLCFAINIIASTPIDQCTSNFVNKLMNFTINCEKIHSNFIPKTFPKILQMIDDIKFIEIVLNHIKDLDWDHQEKITEELYYCYILLYTAYKSTDQDKTMNELSHAFLPTLLPLIERIPPSMLHSDNIADVFKLVAYSIDSNQTSAFCDAYNDISHPLIPEIVNQVCVHVVNHKDPTVILDIAQLIRKELYSGLDWIPEANRRNALTMASWFSSPSDLLDMANKTPIQLLQMAITNFKKGPFFTQSIILAFMTDEKRPRLPNEKKIFKTLLSNNLSFFLEHLPPNKPENAKFYPFIVTPIINSKLIYLDVLSSELGKQPEKYIRKLGKELINHKIIKVYYYGEKGADEGGLTRDFFWRLLDALKTNGRVVNGLPIWKPDADEVEQRAFYESLGRILAFLLMAEGEFPIGQLFNEKVFEMLICSKPEESYQDFANLSFVRKLEMFAKLDPSFAFISEMQTILRATTKDNIPEILGPLQEWYRIQMEDIPLDYTGENRKLDANKVFQNLSKIQKEIKEAFSLPLGSFENSIKPYFWIARGMFLQKSVRKKAQELEAGGLNLIIQGEFSRQGLKDSLEFIDVSEDIQKQFKDWIDKVTTSDEDLQRFLAYVTGAPALSLGKKIQIKGLDVTKVMAHSCFFIIDMPKDIKEKGLKLFFDGFSTPSTRQDHTFQVA